MDLWSLTGKMDDLPGTIGIIAHIGNGDECIVLTQSPTYEKDSWYFTPKSLEPYKELEKPNKLEEFMYGLMKEARKNGLYYYFKEGFDVSNDEVDECIEYIEKALDVKL